MLLVFSLFTYYHFKAFSFNWLHSNQLYGKVLPYSCQQVHLPNQDIVELQQHFFYYCQMFFQLVFSISGLTISSIKCKKKTENAHCTFQLKV